jgi:hypothetical protein
MRLRQPYLRIAKRAATMRDAKGGGCDKMRF